jgi:hypothetical protein
MPMADLTGARCGLPADVRAVVTMRVTNVV